MDFFLEYWLFDGHLTLLQGLWDLVSFSESSHWKMVFLGFLIGFVIKKIHTKQWFPNFQNLWIITYPVTFVLIVGVFGDSFTIENKTPLYDAKETARVMDYDYDQWRNKDPNGTVNPEWEKEREHTRKEIIYYRELILVQLSNQTFFFLFLIVGFFYKKHTFRNAIYQVKSGYQAISKEIDSKKEQAVYEKKQEELEEKRDEERTKRLEEMSIQRGLEAEKARVAEAEASVKLKELDKTRPEKEEKLSKILDKLDDL